MHLVDEDDGAPPVPAHAFGLGHHFLDFLDSGKDGAEGNEFRFRALGDDARERRLAAAGRAPEQHRAEIVALDLGAQRLAGAEQFFLADEFVERLRTHAVGQRTPRQRFFFRLDCVKQAHAMLVLAFRSLGTLACRFVEHDRRSDSRVERLHRVRRRNRNHGVGGVRDFLRQTRAFVADKKCRRFAPIGARAGFVAPRLRCRYAPSSPRKSLGPRCATARATPGSPCRAATEAAALSPPMLAAPLVTTDQRCRAWQSRPWRRMPPPISGSCPRSPDPGSPRARRRAANFRALRRCRGARRRIPTQAAGTARPRLAALRYPTRFRRACP